MVETIRKTQNEYSNYVIGLDFYNIPLIIALYFAIFSTILPCIFKSESCYQQPALFYWQREAKSSNAEVDYILSISQKIIPIEVKSGTKGSMQSLFQFLKEKKLQKGIRISNENFSNYNSIDVYPLYAVENIRIT